MSRRFREYGCVWVFVVIALIMFVAWYASASAKCEARGGRLMRNILGVYRCAVVLPQ